MGRKRRIRRRPWLVPAILSIFLLIAGVASNLIATDIQPYVKPYRLWVWLAFGVALVATAVLAWWNTRRDDEAANGRSISVRGTADHSVLNTGDDDVIVHGSRVAGDVVRGDKITFLQSPPEQVSAIVLHQLPPPPGDFTGRKAELDDLLDRVEKGSVAISGLQGAGGIGKTALALILAQRLAPRYPDAQLCLDLRGVSPQPMIPAEAMAHVIHAWHPTANLPESEGELIALYMSALHGKRALMLLDNAANADQVLPLLPPEGCLALVTSRQHFELPGCYTRCLDMLSPEDARKLVLRIAPRIADQEADDLAKLCGYLPFALRNAASALESRKDISPADYMNRLGDARKKLSLVAASLSLSYDVLSAEQQKRWRKLGVFPGSFDAPAAAAVWEVEEDRARDTLGELYLRSMVECETEGRYKLHDLSRVYADSKQSETERATSQRRHAEYYCNVARAADDVYEKGGESVLAGLGLFDVERGNIEAGQRWASKHEREDDRAAKLCVDYALGGPYVLALRLHPRERIRWHNSALQAARRLKRRRDEAVALGNLGNAYHLLGEYRRAIEFHEQDLAIAREMGNRRGEAQSLGNLGNAYCSLGEYRRAIESYEASLAIAREIGDRLGEGTALGNLGIAYKSLGDCRRAIEFYEQQLLIAREIGDRLGEGAALGNLGNAYYSLGEHRRAIEFHEQDLAIARDMGDRLGEGHALWNMSLALDKLGERARAIANAQAALAIYEQIEAPDTARVRRKLAEWQGEE